jgi:hypothetical protein
MCRTRTFRVCRYSFAFRSCDQGLARYLDKMFEAAATTGEPANLYTIAPDHERDYAHLIYRNERLAMTTTAAFVPRFLTWDVNRRAIRGVQASRVMLHAGVVARHERALLLPAEMEAGKTTLVAGLLERGFEYLSDEAAVLDPSTFHVEPFPKPLSLDKGSWRLFPDRRPELPGPDDYTGEQWHLGPRSFGANAVPNPIPVALVVFPRYVAGAPTRLRPVRPVDSLMRLLNHTFGLREHLERNLVTLGGLAERISSYALTVGTLSAACDSIEDLFHPVNAMAAAER